MVEYHHPVIRNGTVRVDLPPPPPPPPPPFLQTCSEVGEERDEFIGGSAEQPQLVRDGRALSQPKPHPSDRIE